MYYRRASTPLWLCTFVWTKRNFKVFDFIRNVYLYAYITKTTSTFAVSEINLQSVESVAKTRVYDFQLNQHIAVMPNNNYYYYHSFYQ